MKPVFYRKWAATAMLTAFAFGSGFGQHDPQQPFKGKIGKTIEDTQQWWQQQVKAPKGAPNVVWILLDDVGFGATSAFGGLIATPNFEKLAKNGRFISEMGL